MHDAAAAPLLASLPAEERYTSWHLVRSDGPLTGRGAGLAALSRSMTPTRPAARLLDAVPDRVLEALYDVVAQNRDRLGSLVPNGPAPRRFP